MNPLQVIKRVKGLLEDGEFKCRHRSNQKAFSRQRKLWFPLVILLVLQKSMKSLQLVLNEFFSKVPGFQGVVSASAFTQARRSLRYTAFVELNQKAIVEVVYANPHYRRWKGFRLLGVDGSKIRLPDTAALRQHFGTISMSNPCADLQGEYPAALASVCYDLLNHVALHSCLAEARAYEVNLAIQHLGATQEQDLLLMDRNYPSYRLLATLNQHQRHFVIRCSKASFRQARRMLKGQGPSSQIVTLCPPPEKRAEIEALHLPRQITARFVRVLLPTGEAEVLVTSLLDEAAYPTADFKDLYHQRWGVETFYGLLKERLGLEAFSGKTPEAVLQDFHAAVFLSGLEAILTEDSQQILDHKTPHNRYPQQVNRAVSFNAIKNHVLELFYTHSEPQQILQRLSQLFLTAPLPVREGRHFPRNFKPCRALLNYHKRRKKLCF